MSGEATSRRVEGPTPAGGAYSIAYFYHYGMPVPERFANQMLIVEYNDADQQIQQTFGHCTPTAVLPRHFVPNPDAPSPPDDSLRFFAASLGRARLKRPIAEGPPLTTQAVCLARAYVIAGVDKANRLLASDYAEDLIAHRNDLNERWISAPWRGSPHFMQSLDHGAGRSAVNLPDGVDEQDVIVLDLDPYRRAATDRLKEVRDLLKAQVADDGDPEAEFALWLATNALRSEDAARSLWKDLLKHGRRFVKYFKRHPVSTIRVDMTRESSPVCGSISSKPGPTCSSIRSRRPAHG
jgi:hypothetical protein